MTTHRAVTLLLMAVASFLIAVYAWTQSPGDIWATIGLLLVPLCLAALGLVVWMCRDEM